jgi:hypothetical protein
MQYTILYYNSYAGLIDLVNQHIQKGWRPQGGLAIESTETMLAFYQAMVRDE